MNRENSIIPARSWNTILNRYFVRWLRFIRRGMLRRLTRFLNGPMPRGLWARSLLILFVPIVATAIVAAVVFYDRYRDAVTQRLSGATVREIALIADLRLRAQGGDANLLSHLASDFFDMSVAFLPGESLPQFTNTPVVAILHDSLSQEIKRQVGERPFSIDTTTYENDVDIRILLPGEVMRVLVRRENIEAGNTLIFMVWLFGTAVIVLLISTLFLRNQVRPIERLATAAEDFGKGRDTQKFVPAGASEVRRAANAFIEMRQRIESHIEQNMITLSGIGHDLRTPLTRIRLGIAMLNAQSDELNAIEQDIEEMGQMLDDYLEFVRGDQNEVAIPVAIDDFLAQTKADAHRRWSDHHISLDAQTGLVVPFQSKGLRRCLTNLINNGCAHADKIYISATHDQDAKHLVLTVDDNGPGIPEDQFEEVFRPFFRLDPERASGEGGSGLGLPSARNVAKRLGGDIALEKSTYGGLRAKITLPI